MTTTTTTPAESKGGEADKADQDATGGDPITETGDSSNKKFQELETNFNRTAHKLRTMEKSFKETNTKLEAILSRLSSSDSDDDGDDDEGDGEGEGGEAGKGEEGKPPGKPVGKSQNPETKKLLKKLERERTDSANQITAVKNQADAWKALWVQEKTRQLIETEVAKYDVLPHAKADLIEGIERKVEANADDDGTIEVSHKDYPSLSKFVEEFVNDRPHTLRNSRASGTGDGGGAESKAGGGDGGVKIPNLFNTWPPEKQKEWVMKLTPDQRKQIAKQIQW